MQRSLPKEEKPKLYDNLASANHQFNSKEERPDCALCVELGRKVAVNHKYEDCWLNPNSQNFKEKLYNAKIR